MSQSTNRAFLGLCVTILLVMPAPAGHAKAASTDPLVIESARLKPDVLYIDLANPSDARGISLFDKEERAKLVPTKIAGLPATKPQKNRLNLLTDPSLIKDRAPVLAALNYYEPKSYGRFWVHGFLDSPHNNIGRYSNRSGLRATRCDAWRWRTFIGYANFDYALWWKKGYRKGKQAPFVLRPKEVSPRWILMLPLTDAKMKEVKAVRKKVLAMLADYNRLCVAHARLSGARSRLEQVLKCSESGRKTHDPREGLFQEAVRGTSRAARQMDDVINQVRVVYDTAYLGFFDGNMHGRGAAVSGFQKKAIALARQYNALAARIEKGISGFTKTALKKRGLQAIILTAPPPIATNALLRTRDLNDRFYFGVIGNLGYLHALPQSSMDSLWKDCRIDFVYRYSFVAESRADGSYDFASVDNVLSHSKRNKGMRAIVGLHNIHLPRWAQKKFFGKKAERKKAGSHSGWWAYRIKEGPGKPDTVALLSGVNTHRWNLGCNQGLAWSDALIQYSADFHRAMGKHLRNNPVVLKYNINGEGGTTAVMAAGYVYDAARPFFHAHLKKNFGAIGALNKAFGTAYGSFAEIPLPRPAKGEKMVRLTPAYYEYVQLSIDRLKLARETAARALKEGDPNRAIGEVHSGVFGAHQLDTYKLAVDTPYDTFAAGQSALFSARYTYSLNRYRPRPIWLYEPYVMKRVPRDKWSSRIEELGRRTLISEIWTWFLWGQQGVPLYADSRMNAAVYDRRLADIVPLGHCPWKPTFTCPAIRPCSGCLASLRPVLDKVLVILKKAPVVAARIGLLESSTTHAVPYPTRATYADVNGIQVYLENTHRHFFFIPETAIKENVEKLDQFRIIICAYATHLRPEVRRKLLQWVKKGGILIGSGPLALYDHYGRTEGNLPKEVFGMDNIVYSPETAAEAKLANCRGAMAGWNGHPLWCAKDFYWRFPRKGLLPGTRVLASLADGTPVVVERAYGAGKVAMTATPIGLTSDILRPVIAHEINEAIPVPVAQSTASRLRLQVREDAQGTRYLGIINRNVKEPQEAVVVVAGEFTNLRDITVGGGLPIPSKCGGGVTRFPIWMGPGMASFIRLGKPSKKLSALSPEAESVFLQMAQFSSLLKKAGALGINTRSYYKILARTQKHYARGEYRAARTEVSRVYKEIMRKTINTHAEAIKRRGLSAANPISGSLGASYAEIAKAFVAEGKATMAEERLAMAEKALARDPAPRKAEVVFPFVKGKLGLPNLSKWPKANWQIIYRDKATREEAGRFCLVGSPEGIYVAARVKEATVTDKSQRTGIQWRAMDGVVLNLRCLDKTEKLSAAFRSEDTYEITFYADGSVFVWENPLQNTTRLIKNRVTRVREGYQVAGFIPAEAVRFWPRSGVTIIIDVAVCSYDDDKPRSRSVSTYWHGKYAKAETWARVQLGPWPVSTSRAALSAASRHADRNTAEPCVKAEHWVRHDNRGVGTAVATVDAAERLPNGKSGAIVLTRPDRENRAQLRTQFSAIGKRRGLQVWLRGEGSGGAIELRVSGREGYTWAMRLKDDFKQWKAVVVDLASCEKTREDRHSELLSGETASRPNLNRLIVRLTRPASRVKVGLVEYLE